MTAENTKEPTGKLKFAYDTIAKLEEQNAALIAERDRYKNALSHISQINSIEGKVAKKALTTK